MARSSFTSPSTRPYGTSAGEHMALCWALGDWEALSGKVEGCGLPDNAVARAYKVAALMQVGDFETASNSLGEFDLDGEARDLLLRLLISGALNSLGKANACSFNHELARELFVEAVGIGLTHQVEESIADARAASQLGHMGMPSLKNRDAERGVTPDIESFLKSARAFFPYEPALETALADFYQREERFDKAIIQWQKVAQLLEKDTPQAYYDQLKNAYRSARAFPRGCVDQETVKGDIDKHELLASIHENLAPEFYFEIGVQTGRSLALANCEALGIDPMPAISVKLGENTSVMAASSDAFFAAKSDVLLSKSVDLVFIDGMHLFEYALRDFMNIERYLTSSSLVVIDDIYPGHADQAKRDRCTRAWTGDVWKVKAILEQYRPELILLPIDAHPTGLLLITGCQSGNTVLYENYDAIIKEYHHKTVRGKDIDRTDSVSGNSAAIDELVKMCADARVDDSSAKDLEERWQAIRCS